MKQDKTKDSIDETLEEFDEKIQNEFRHLKKDDTSYHLASKTVAKECGKKYILQAIIKEYKSMVEEIENDWGMVAPAGLAPFLLLLHQTDWAIGYQDALKERITSLNKKIINLESKLK